MPGDGEDETEQPPSRVQRAVAAAAGAAVGIWLGPGGMLAGAAAGPYLEELARRAWDEFRPDSQRRQAEMLGSTAAASGRDPEELAGLLGASEHSRLLTAQALSGAAGTAWPPKVSALGRALADGLIADDTQANLADLVLPAMIDMERPHVELLDLLANRIPIQIGPDSWDAKPDLKTRPGRRGPPRWTVPRIARARPALQPALSSLMGTLQRHGLANQNDNLAEAIENYSKANENDISRRSLRGGGGRPTTPAAPRALSRLDPFGHVVPEPTWSVTSLGERVLEYYHLAAAEFDEHPET
jgi:hypothetical protein